MEDKIEVGDRVKHKSSIEFGGLDMPVIQISNGKVLCTYFDTKDLDFKDRWFLIEELEIYSKGIN